MHDMYNVTSKIVGCRHLVFPMLEFLSKRVSGTRSDRELMGGVCQLDFMLVRGRCTTQMSSLIDVASANLLILFKEG